MTRRPRGLLVLLVTALAWAVLQPSHAASPLLLEVATAEGLVIWTTTVQDGEPFELAFTHSSEGCRWHHRYLAVARGRIRQVDSVFPCFGAGMPSGPGEGMPLARTPDGYVSSAPLTLTAIPMLNWRRAQIDLQVRGQRWPIGQWVPDFGAFVVRIR